MIEGYYYLTEKGKGYLKETHFFNCELGSVWKLIAVKQGDFIIRFRFTDTGLRNFISFPNSDPMASF